MRAAATPITSHSARSPRVKLGGSLAGNDSSSASSTSSSRCRSLSSTSLSGRFALMVSDQVSRIVSGCNWFAYLGSGSPDNALPILLKEQGRSLGGIASSRSVVLGVHDRPGPASKYVQTVGQPAARGDARPPMVVVDQGVNKAPRGKTHTTTG